MQWGSRRLPNKIGWSNLYSTPYSNGNVTPRGLPVLGKKITVTSTRYITPIQNARVRQTSPAAPSPLAQAPLRHHPAAGYHFAVLGPPPWGSLWGFFLGWGSGDGNALEDSWFSPPPTPPAVSVTCFGTRSTRPDDDAARLASEVGGGIAVVVCGTALVERRASKHSNCVIICC